MQTAPLKALIFDSLLRLHITGVVVYVRVMDGTVKPGDRITNDGVPAAEFDVVEVGVMRAVRTRRTGRASRRARSDISRLPSKTSQRDASVGDTVTLADRPAQRAASRLPSARSPMVYSRHLSRGRRKLRRLRETRSKSCSSTTLRCPLSRRPPSALGFGFRCGFLGLLHMEIIQERLEREFNLDLITTAPSRYLQDRQDATATINYDRQPHKLPRPVRDSSRRTSRW